jgi:hypothetical protein
MSKRHVQKSAPQPRSRLSVVPRPTGWVVEGFPAGAAQVYKTQREAVAAARKLIEPRAGGEIVVRGRDGRIRGVDSYTLGQHDFERISAVEGIHLSEDLKRDFRRLDRKRLSAEERRDWLIAKYGARRDKL